MALAAAAAIRQQSQYSKGVCISMTVPLTKNVAFHKIVVKVIGMAVWIYGASRSSRSILYMCSKP